MADKTREILHMGWLIKSPPESKMNRAFLKAQWKRRYFVLQETVSQMPGQNSSLIYYKDQNQRSKKGTIDLEHCEEVLSALDSPHYPHLFGIKTLHKKGGSRTYYLASETEEDMSKWVNCLCTVLGLKENDDQPSPDRRSEIFNENLDNIAPVSSQTQLKTGSNTSLDGPPPEVPPPREVRPSPEGYTNLEDCYSGPRADEDDEGPISSIPIDLAPLPPIKTHQKMVAKGGGTGEAEETYDSPQKSYKKKTGANVDDNDNVYKYPPPSSQARVIGEDPPEESMGSLYKHPPTRTTPRPVHSELYNKVPPARSVEFKGGQRRDSEVATEPDEDVYKVPPPRPEQVEYDIPPSHSAPHAPSLQRKPSERDSGSSTASKGSQGHTDDSGFSEVTEVNSANRYNQRYGGMSGSSSHSNGAALSTKSSLLEVVPPPPPPAPHKTAPGGDASLARSESRYINLPPNSKSHPETQVPPPGLPHKNPDIAYDFPVNGAPSNQRKKSDAEILGMSPPPPPCDKKGGAMNIHRYTNAPPGYILNEMGGSYLPMSPTSSTGSGDSYLPMDNNAGGRKDSSSSSYLPMDNSGQPGQQGSYMPMDKQMPKQDYLPMDNSSSSGAAREGYMPMGSSGPGDDSYLPASPTSPRDNYCPAGNGNRDSIYGIITDSSMSRSSDTYAFPPSNIPVTEDIYDMSPSNLPVVGLQTQLPAPVTRTSDVYATHPSNKPVAPTSQRALLEAYPPPPDRDSTYDTPPSRPNISKRKPPTGSPRFKPKDKSAPVQFVSRSRSFKRTVSPPRPDVQLPQRNNLNDDSSSDDDEDSSEAKSVSSHERSLESVLPKHLQKQPPIPKRSLHSTPPPPKKAGEIQYLDLDLDLPKDSSDPERSPAACTKSPSRTISSSVTEYREIDFVRTDALTQTKKEIESKRKSSEKSVDE